MSDLEETVGIMYDRVTQREYIAGARECNDCSENKQLFIYSNKPRRILCAECILKEIRRKMPKCNKPQALYTLLLIYNML